MLNQEELRNENICKIPSMLQTTIALKHNTKEILCTIIIIKIKYCRQHKTFLNLVC